MCVYIVLVIVWSKHIQLMYMHPCSTECGSWIYLHATCNIVHLMVFSMLISALQTKQMLPVCQCCASGRSIMYIDTSGKCTKDL